MGECVSNAIYSFFERNEENGMPEPSRSVDSNNPELDKNPLLT